MVMIRQYAVAHNGMVQVAVPEEYNEREVEVQVILTAKEAEPNETQLTTKSGLGHLVGKYRHYTPEQNAEIDRELRDLRDSWERPIS